jgi:hypothetical protein
LSSSALLLGLITPDVPLFRVWVSLVLSLLFWNGLSCCFYEYACLVRSFVTLFGYLLFRSTLDFGPLFSSSQRKLYLRTEMTKFIFNTSKLTSINLLFHRLHTFFILLYKTRKQKLKFAFKTVDSQCLLDWASFFCYIPTRQNFSNVYIIVIYLMTFWP